MRVPPDWDRPCVGRGQAASYYPQLLFPDLAENGMVKPVSDMQSSGLWGGRGFASVATATASVAPPEPPSHTRIDPVRPDAARFGAPASPNRTPPAWPEGSGRLPASPLQERPQQDNLFDLQVPSCGSRGTVQDGPADKSTAPEQDVEVRCVPNGEVISPWRAWTDVKFPQRLLEQLVRAGFPAPTKIQQHAWAIASKGHDMIGIAKTGSGKTLAFLLPAFARLVESNADPRAPPAILVLAPTRELACQIEQEASTFGKPAGMRTVCLYGGTPKGPQLAELRGRPQLIVATPGRLNDLLDPPPGMTLGVDVKSVKFLVLDEADRMLDMGFEPQIRKIILCIPTERQTMMFTATWPASVRRLASEFLKEPVEVRVGEVEELSVNPDITQSIVFVNGDSDRQERLAELIRDTGDDQVIVFVSTKRMCDSLSFRTPGSIAIHGDKDQRERDMALAAFKSGSKRVLVATDVAARGLDIKSVRHVINFEPPNNCEDYVHRVGRTGRAGLKGKAVSLLSNDDGTAARFIAEMMRKNGTPVPEELERRLASGEMRSGGGGRARSQSRGPSRGGGSRFGNDDDNFDFGGDMGGSRSGGFGGGSRGRSGGDMRNDCSNSCPTW